MSRRTARETVFKLAFEYSFNREFNSDTLELMTMDATMTDDDRNFVESTYKGVINFYDELKSLIEKNISGYSIDRIYRSDFIVLMLSLSYIPLHKIACSLLTVTLSSFLIGKIHGLSFPKKKSQDNQSQT